MADVALTAAQVEPAYPSNAEIYTGIAAATITKGQILYLNSSGNLDLADANGSGTLQVRGMALNGAAAGEVVEYLKRGIVYGFTVSSIAYDAPIYLSNTAGALADAAGGTSINCGRITLIQSSGTLTKVLYFEADWLRTWA